MYANRKILMLLVLSIVWAALPGCGGDDESPTAPPKPATIQRQVLALDRQHYPDNHPNVAHSLMALGSTLTENGQYDEAMAIKLELVGARAQGGRDHAYAHGAGFVGNGPGG